MSQLEEDTGSLLAGWVGNPGSHLGAEGVAVLTRWLVKTLFVLSFAEGDSRQFMTSPTETMVPDVTIAKKLIAEERLAGIAAGAAQAAPTNLLWALGNPTISGPEGLSSRVVNAAAFNLGPLQMWVAVPLIRPDELTLPPRIDQLTKCLIFSDLRPGQSSLDLSEIRATYSPITASQI